MEYTMLGKNNSIPLNKNLSETNVGYSFSKNQ